jgi:hypothetical protein
MYAVNINVTIYDPNRAVAFRTASFTASSRLAPWAREIVAPGSTLLTWQKYCSPILYDVTFTICLPICSIFSLYDSAAGIMYISGIDLSARG